MAQNKNDLIPSRVIGMQFSILSAEEIRKAERTLYNSFYSPSYILRHSVKGMQGNFYSQIMVRTALNHFLWRLKLPLLFSKIVKKLSLQRWDCERRTNFFLDTALFEIKC